MISLRDLIPWGRRAGNVPAPPQEAPEHPLAALQRETHRLFDSLLGGFDRRFPPFVGGWGWPRVETTETEREVRVRAELPGMDENDLEVLVENGMLTIRGERRSEMVDRRRRFARRFYGRFERRISIGSRIDEEKASACFRNGVLEVTLPKLPGAPAGTRRLAINQRSPG
jgi:HSP20 family protein